MLHQMHKAYIWDDPVVSEEHRFRADADGEVGQRGPSCSRDDERVVTLDPAARGADEEAHPARGHVVSPCYPLMVISGLSAVLFFFGLMIVEPIPEIPVDIDFKPFFIPLLLVAVLPVGKPAVAGRGGRGAR